MHLIQDPDPQHWYQFISRISYGAVSRGPLGFNSNAPFSSEVRDTTSEVVRQLEAKNLKLTEQLNCLEVEKEEAAHRLEAVESRLQQKEQELEDSFRKQQENAAVSNLYHWTF
jgi:hypothetical protein